MSARRHSRSAFSTQLDAQKVADELAGAFEDLEPRALLFFSSHRHDGRALSGKLRERFPGAEVIGCSSAGEFTERHQGQGGVTAIALGPGAVAAAASAMVDLRGGRSEKEGVNRACREIEAKLEVSLREADPDLYVGIELLEGLKMKEERINEALGNVAPLLSFVGGSAGDNLEFERTTVFRNGEETDDGAVLLVLRCAVPFAVVKTCSFESRSRSWTVTRGDTANRVVYELDHRPVLEVYAEALGLSPSQVDASVFMSAPFGLLIDGKPWIRAPARVLPDGGFKFLCQVPEGMHFHLMRSTNLVRDTRAALDDARAELGAPIQSAIAFNCILRRLEIDAAGLQGDFYDSFRGITTAGFHTYGESWLGHVNQTITGLVLA